MIGHGLGWSMAEIAGLYWDDMLAELELARAMRGVEI